jgi:2-dehydro-3-deoxygluconokinase
VLRDAAWFHFSGITAGISLKAAEAARQGAIAARQLGLTVSCDFNYRARLWSQEACAKTMHELIPHTDMLIANENHLQRMIVKDFPPSQSGSDESDLDYAAALGQKLFSMYKLRWVVVTLRRTYSTHRQGIGAVWVEPHSRAPGYFRQTDVLEPVGGGDALTAGLIHRMLAGATPQEAVEFGVSAACFKHSYPGDFFVGTEADVTACLAGASGKRFQR